MRGLLAGQSYPEPGRTRRGSGIMKASTGVGLQLSIRALRAELLKRGFENAPQVVSELKKKRCQVRAERRCKYLGLQIGGTKTYDAGHRDI